MITLSKANQALVVPPVCASFFPDAPALPDGNIVVPHNMRTMKVLEHLGAKDIPNPMMLYYDWGSKQPFGVQRATCKMLTENPHAYVLNHMGTGKTKAALWAWDYLYSSGMVGKLLVVAPLSTLNFVWAREVFSTLPRRRVVVLHGTRQERLDRLAQDADIYIINHDGLKVIESELRARADVDCLVLDELAVYRNNSDRSKLMRKFAARFQVVWGMTGKPMPNEPPDVWHQCMIVTPNQNGMPKSLKWAKTILMTPTASPYVWLPRPDAVDTAFKWMQPAVRYSLEDVVELPDITYRTIDVDMTDVQKKIYDKVRRECQAMIADKAITALNAGAAMGKLLQIAGGWVYSKAPDFVRIDASPRVAALVDLIMSSDRKVIVFVPYRHAIEGLSAILDMKGITIEHAVIHGDTKDREEIFTQFQQTNKFKVLLAHPGTISHGLTLTAADTIIWYMPIMSLDTYEQANARIRRVGQTHKQQVLHLQSSAVERKIYAMLQRKQKIQDTLLAMFEDATEGL
jgi:SNF2-related domain/Helicase conserved C-terminal domain